MKRVVTTEHSHASRCAGDALRDAFRTLVDGMVEAVGSVPDHLLPLDADVTVSGAKACDIRTDTQVLAAGEPFVADSSAVVRNHVQGLSTEQLRDIRVGMMRPLGKSIKEGEWEAASQQALVGDHRTDEEKKAGRDRFAQAFNFKSDNPMQRAMSRLIAFGIRNPLAPLLASIDLILSHPTIMSPRAKRTNKAKKGPAKHAANKPTRRR